MLIDFATKSMIILPFIEQQLLWGACSLNTYSKTYWSMQPRVGLFYIYSEMFFFYCFLTCIVLAYFSLSGMPHGSNHQLLWERLYKLKLHDILQGSKLKRYTSIEKAAANGALMSSAYTHKQWPLQNVQFPLLELSTGPHLLISSRLPSLKIRERRLIN